MGSLDPKIRSCVNYWCVETLGAINRNFYSKWIVYIHLLFKVNMDHLKHFTPCSKQICAKNVCNCVQWGYYYFIWYAAVDIWIWLLSFRAIWGSRPGVHCTCWRPGFDLHGYGSISPDPLHYIFIQLYARKSQYYRLPESWKFMPYQEQKSTWPNEHFCSIIWEILLDRRLF